MSWILKNYTLSRAHQLNILLAFELLAPASLLFLSSSSRPIITTTKHYQHMRHKKKRKKKGPFSSSAVLQQKHGKRVGQTGVSAGHNGQCRHPLEGKLQQLPLEDASSFRRRGRRREGVGEDGYKENETNSPFFTIRSQRHKFLLCVCAKITDLHLDLKNRG